MIFKAVRASRPKLAMASSGRHATVCTTKRPRAENSLTATSALSSLILKAEIHLRGNLYLDLITQISVMEASHIGSLL